MQDYRLFDIDVRSEIPLPGLAAAEGKPSMTIRRGPTPARLDRAAGGGVCYSAAPREALIAVPNVGRFHVRGGEEIVVDAPDGVAPDHLRLFLLNVAIAVLLHQRNELVLHAAAIETNGGCIALAGPSGAGKSTVAAAWYGRGGRVLTDEICLVRTDDAGVPHVIPGPPSLHVWDDALRRVGWEPADFQPVRAGMKKYAVPVEERLRGSASPLKAIYVLTQWNRASVEAVPLTGRDRFETLVQNTLRFEYLAPMGLRAAHFERLTALAPRVPVVRVQRGSHPHGLDELLAVL